MGYFKIFAHRGGDFSRKKIHPNSLRAFEESYAIGANGIETDICLSKDGEPIICHPGLLSPDPPELTWKQIKKFYGDILHFNDLFYYLLRRPSFFCLLDLKINSGKLVEMVCGSLEKSDLKNKVFLTAPKKRIAMAGLYADGQLLSHAKTISRGKIKTHIIDVWPTSMIGTINQFQPDMISFGWLNDSLLSRVLFNLMFETKIIDPFIELPAEVEKIKAMGTTILGGIANTPTDINYLLNAGVDGIVTDNPALAVEIRNSQTP